MYLSKLKISGFRKLNACELEFRPGLNILVGPNNVGKTTVIDALRALLATEDGQLRLTEDDLHVDKSSNNKASSIYFQYTFKGLSRQNVLSYHPTNNNRLSISIGQEEYQRFYPMSYPNLSPQNVK